MLIDSKMRSSKVTLQATDNLESPPALMAAKIHSSLHSKKPLKMALKDHGDGTKHIRTVESLSEHCLQSSIDQATAAVSKPGVASGHGANAWA